MQKTLLIVLALAVTALSATPAAAADALKLGFGYFRADAPVGGRAWVNDKVAVDLGIGLANQDMEFTDHSGTVPVVKTEKKTSFTVEAGVPYVLVGDETTRFFVRPGFMFGSTPAWDSADRKWVSATELGVSGTLGVEHWFGKRFSLGAGHGLIFKSVDPGTKGSESSSSIMSEALSLSNVGFHFYFN